MRSKRVGAKEEKQEGMLQPEDKICRMQVLVALNRKVEYNCCSVKETNDMHK